MGQVEEEQEGKGDEVEVMVEQEQENRERKEEKKNLHPVVRVQRLDKRTIRAWVPDSEESGSILKRGLKFSSAESFLSFIEADRSQVDAALQPSPLEIDNAYSGGGVNEEQESGEKAVGHGKEADGGSEAGLSSNCEPGPGSEPGLSGEFQGNRYRNQLSNNLLFYRHCCWGADHSV